MSSRRIAKVAEALRETISMAVLFEIKDPRVRNVTVLRTEVSPDLKSARVFVSVMGDEKAQSLAMHGLRSARGFIQSRIADRLELRYTPILQFVLDPAVKLSVQASAIIREALADDTTGHDVTGHDAVGDDTTGHDTTGHDTTGHDADAAADSNEPAANEKF
ncbi:MAG TPA: 30S ribosome-binding factor RbfA [Planctomycetaceae bacterium]